MGNILSTHDFRNLFKPPVDVTFSSSNIKFMTNYSNFPEAPPYQIRAHFTDKIIRVYQAYSDDIADAALKQGTFVSPPFSMTRMTWIKPSFLWMMYRSNWARKDIGQQRILAIDISHEGFEWALTHAALSHCPPHMTHEEWRKWKDASPVVIQWDPERDLLFRPLAHRSLQIGLGPTAVNLYVNDWIRNITDVTPLAKSVGVLVDAGRYDEVLDLLPVEKIFEPSFKMITPENT
ncbi:DUF4291 domain-containing protein [Rhizobium sp. FKL33]|uniref:DUF4291 domain-containing protein n=1 Tax=Rhizobium sp. FKL33 TaxID=2562307 RepID=UPI00197FA110|nr:DUF4291 domain-containing protein [Rhizobium sp. FKL33]